MIVQWAMATTLLLSFALGLGKAIHHSIRELSWHREGWRLVTQSLVQRPSPPTMGVRLKTRGPWRSYGYRKREVWFRFHGHYRGR